MPGEEPNAAVMKVATEGGMIKFDIEHRVRAVYGRQLGIAGDNGGYSYVALFYRNNRLYQIEGTAFLAGGQAEVDAARFQRSLDRSISPDRACNAPLTRAASRLEPVSVDSRTGRYSPRLSC